MGISIHYSGEVRDQKMISSLTEEVKDICKSLDWESHTFNYPKIKGVCFAPNKSEPIFLTFNNEGRMLSPLALDSINTQYGLPKEIYYTTSTKTQFAGVWAHIAIIRLLKYLDKKYLKNFVVSDEGNYWETGNEKIVTEQFRKITVAMDIFEEALKESPTFPDESAESLLNRLEKILKEKFRDENKK